MMIAGHSVQFRAGIDPSRLFVGLNRDTGEYPILKGNEHVSSLLVTVYSIAIIPCLLIVEVALSRSVFFNE